MSNNAEFLEAASTALGREYVSIDRLTLRAYERDSYPLALRANGGYAGTRDKPSAVLWPRSTADVAMVLRLAQAHGTTVVPYGGGSGICGSALPAAGAVIIDTKLMNRCIKVDTHSLAVTVQAGILGGELERHLNALGYTCGHYPQSLFSSTVGGWIAHRGAGAMSTKYGKVEDLLLGVQVVLPTGEIWQARDVPASAAGPDLSRLFLGAEGALGIVTEATFKIFPLSTYSSRVAMIMPSMVAGLDAGRRIVQAGLRPAIVRLYDSIETAALFGDATLPPDAATLLIIDEGCNRELIDLTIAVAGRVATELGGWEPELPVADLWQENRYSTAGLCDTLSDPTGIADALEVANQYSRLPVTYLRMKEAMLAAAGNGGRVFGHASHFYHTGANLYLIFHASATSEDAVPALYHTIVDAALTACLAEGGTLSHHHGVGIAKNPHMTAEWGATGLAMWDRIRRQFDPDRVMNQRVLTG